MTQFGSLNPKILSQYSSKTKKKGFPILYNDYSWYFGGNCKQGLR